MTTTITLSPTSTKLLAAFDEAARDWGWQRDQGSGEAVLKSEAWYIECDAELRKRINTLERQVRRLKQELKAQAPTEEMKSAVTSPMIVVKYRNGLVEVKNPFYSSTV